MLTDLPEREMTRGWLKASHGALEPKRSKAWRPWHPLTREAQQKVSQANYGIPIEIFANADLSMLVVAFAGKCGGRHADRCWWHDKRRIRSRSCL